MSGRDMLAACGCGHRLHMHGRRGYGSCRTKSWTEYGRKEAERIEAESEAEHKDVAVTVVVLETLFALPGMHEVCKCKRFHVAKDPT